MIRACLFDIGNTLICKSKGVGLTDSLLYDLRTLRARGVQLGVASIRTLKMAKEALPDFDFDFYILFDGAVIIENGETIYENPLPINVPKENALALYCSEGIYAKNESAGEELNRRGFVYSSFGFPASTCYAMACPRGECPEGLQIVTWEKSNLDVCLAKGVSKRSALSFLMEKHGWKDEEIAVFGDGPNDISMLANLPNSVSMAGAPEALVECSAFQTGFCYEGGVSNAMRFLGIPPITYLLFIESKDGDVGGMETHAKYLKEFLFDKGSVFVISHRDGKNQIVDSNISFPYSFNDLARSLQGKDVRIFFNSGHWIEEMREIRHLFPRARILYRTGGNEIPSAPLKDMSVPFADRQRYWVDVLNETVDTLITNSRFTERRLEDLGIKGSILALCRGGVPYRRIVSTNKQQTKERLYPQGKIHLLCSARFVPYKRISLLLQAFERLPEDYDLTLIGDGPEWEGLVHQFENHPRIRFLGKVPHEEVLSYIVGADIYVQTSGNLRYEVPGGSYIHCEGMGRTILEAIAARTFVVATDSGAFSEIITGRRGVISPDDPSAIAKAICSAHYQNLPEDEEAPHFDFDFLFERYLMYWRKSKVALVTSKYLGIPDGGGSSMVTSLVDALKEDCDLDFLCLRTKREGLPGMDAFRAYAFLPNPYREEGKFQRRLLSISYYKEKLSPLVSGYDSIVVVHTSKAFGLSDELLPKTIVFPMFTGFDYGKSGEDVPKEYINEEKRVYGLCRCIVVPCLQDLETLEEVYGVDRRKIVVIPRGISPLFEGKSKKKPPFDKPSLSLMMIANIKKQKNIEEAIEIVSRVKRKGLEATLDIFGAVDDRVLMDRLTVQKPDFVTYHGAVSQEKLHDAMGHFDLLICSSFQETFGRCVYEAALSKLPCLVSSRLKRIIHAFQGSVLSYSNVDEAVNLLVSLNKNQLSYFANRAYLIAQEHSASKEAARLRKVVLSKTGLFVLGTRPEAIKMIPVLQSLAKKGIPVKIIDTWQHGGLATSVLMDYGYCTGRLASWRQGDFEEISNIWAKESVGLFSATPDFVCVQGDTASAFAGAKLASLLGRPLFYVEAGLRSFDESNPYPEEIIRKRISFDASLNFAPSIKEVENLKTEGARGIHLTGNTFPDFLLQNKVDHKEKLIVVTIHRRENLPLLANIFAEIKSCCLAFPNYQFLFPIHPNPIIVEFVKSFEGVDNLILSDPLTPREFQRALSSAYAAITDSGGVEEEAGLLGIPVLVVRGKTERAGRHMFSPDNQGMAEELKRLLLEEPPMPDKRYGTGGAGDRIASIIEEQLYGNN